VSLRLVQDRREREQQEHDLAKELEEGDEDDLL